MKNKIIKLELEDKIYNLEISRYGVGVAYHYGLEDFLTKSIINPIVLPYALFYAFLSKHHEEISFEQSKLILEEITDEYGEELRMELVEKMQEEFLSFMEEISKESEKEKKKGKLTVI